MLLAHIIEKVTGNSYENFIQNKIFNTLEMTNSGLGKNTELWKYIPNMQNHYTNLKVFNEGYVASQIGNTGIVSNVEDLYKWFNGLIDGKILIKETSNCYSPLKLR